MHNKLISPHLFEWSDEGHERVATDNLSQYFVRVVALHGAGLKQFAGDPRDLFLLRYLTK